VTENFYDTNKWMLLCIGALCILIFEAFSLLRTKTSLRITVSSGVIGFGVLAIASTIAVLAGSTNKIEAILLPFGPITFLSLTILIAAGSAITKQGKTWFRGLLYAGAGILGLIAVYQSLGMGKLMFPQISYLQDVLWTPTGSVLTTITIFLITLSLLIPEIVITVKKRQEPATVAVLFISLITILAGAGITIWQCIPKLTSAILPYDVGMTIAGQIFKSPLKSVVGVGVENFLTAITMGRPITIPMAPSVLINFTTNANFFLHMLTAYGLMGLTAATVMVICLLSGSKKEWLFFTKCLCVASLLLIPPTLPLLTVIAAVFIITRKEEHPTKAMSVPAWIRTSIGLLILIVVTASFYFLIRAYTAEVLFYHSLVASAKNDGTKTYNLQIQTIQANTFLSRYHITYSQTNLSLANSIAANTNNTQDKQLVAQLIQQSMREAKIAVALNTQNVAAWENLALTYQTVIPIASGAGNWALSTYMSAAKLDPYNPMIFLNIGSVYTRLQQYDNAIAAFNRSIQLNPSYANAYYNIANVYKLKGDFVNAGLALTTALKLVEPGSADYYKVKNEINALQYPTTNPSPPSIGSSKLKLP
jgi:Flp pilus assembly protein TadD